VLLLVGALVLAAGALQRAGAPVPHVLGDGLILSLSLIAGVFGAIWMWRDDHPRARWQPSHPGRRFQTAVLYTRKGCHLCDDAHSLLLTYSRYLPELAVVDVDGDETLRERWTDCVPVLELDGEPRFRGRISEPLLQRLIEGTPPVR
jgi:hypothetical protein